MLLFQMHYFLKAYSALICFYICQINLFSVGFLADILQSFLKMEIYFQCNYLNNGLVVRKEIYNLKRKKKIFKVYIIENLFRKKK